MGIKELFGGPDASPKPGEEVVVYAELTAVFGENQPTGERFSDIPDTQRRGFVLSWGIKNFGFGEFTFCRKEDGTYVCDSEGTGRSRVEAVLLKFMDNCVMLDGPDAPKSESKEGEPESEPAPAPVPDKT